MFSIVFDPRDPVLDEKAFATVNVWEWKEFNGDVAEEMPPRVPQPRGMQSH